MSSERIIEGSQSHVNPNKADVSIVSHSKMPDFNVTPMNNNDYQDWFSVFLSNKCTSAHPTVPDLDLIDSDKNGFIAKIEFLSASTNKELSEDMQEFSQIMLENFEAVTGFANDDRSKEFTRADKDALYDVYTEELRKKNAPQSWDNILSEFAIGFQAGLKVQLMGLAGYEPNADEKRLSARFDYFNHRTVQRILERTQFRYRPHLSNEEMESVYKDS